MLKLGIAGCALWVAVALALPSSGRALTVELVDVGATPMTSEQLAAFQAAAQAWELKFSDPIVVRLQVAFEPMMPSGRLGGTKTLLTTHHYYDAYNALQSDAPPFMELHQIQQLPIPTFPNSLPPPTPPLFAQDLNGSRVVTHITMATANAKALGLSAAKDKTYPLHLPAGFDGDIRFNSLKPFDYDPNDGVCSGQFDFVTVATHEIGHALGFMSLTDIQQLNPNHVLHANSLDLWRFFETGTSHSISGVESRFVTLGPAEQYDLVLNNVPFSHGIGAPDPDCGSASGQCQASHWSDGTNFLMDPTVGVCQIIGIEYEDSRILSLIGYDLNSKANLKWITEVEFGWYLDGVTDPPPEFDGAFVQFATPPALSSVTPNFDPDFAVRVGFSAPGFEGRGGIGYVRFVNEELNTNPPLVSLSDEAVGEQQNLLSFDPPSETLPPAIADLYFESDTTGVSFTGRALTGGRGIPLDPSIGAYGGYGIALALDGALDDIANDTDATVVLILPADEGGIPDPAAQNVFTALPSTSTLVIHDHAAFGLPAPAPAYAWVFTGTPQGGVVRLRAGGQSLTIETDGDDTAAEVMAAAVAAINADPVLAAAGVSAAHVEKTGTCNCEITVEVVTDPGILYSVSAPSYTATGVPTAGPVGAGVLAFLLILASWRAYWNRRRV